MFQVTLPNIASQSVSEYIGDIPTVASNKTLPQKLDNILNLLSSSSDSTQRGWIDIVDGDRLGPSTDGPFLPSVLKLLLNASLSSSSSSSSSSMNLQSTGHPPFQNNQFSSSIDNSFVNGNINHRNTEDETGWYSLVCGVRAYPESKNILKILDLPVTEQVLETYMFIIHLYLCLLIDKFIFSFTFNLFFNLFFNLSIKLFIYSSIYSSIHWCICFCYQ